MKIYLASPLGFAESTKPFMHEIERRLEDENIEIVNPWRNPLGLKIVQAQSIPDRIERIGRLRSLNHDIAESNEKAIRACDLVIAVLDGVDVDSGTASEVGFAYALGKRLLGLRTDFRLAGDNEAATVNLQVQYWIERSGGKVVSSLDELTKLVAELKANTQKPR